MNKSYPLFPGWHQGSVSTSREAAEEIAPTANTVRNQVERAYIDNPSGLTPDEAAKVVGKSILTVRPRVTELLAMNKLHDTGQRRLNVSGKKAAVFQHMRFIT